LQDFFVLRGYRRIHCLRRRPNVHRFRQHIYATNHRGCGFLVVARHAARHHPCAARVLAFHIVLCRLAFSGRAGLSVSVHGAHISRAARRYSRHPRRRPHRRPKQQYSKQAHTRPGTSSRSDRSVERTTHNVSFENTRTASLFPYSDSFQRPRVQRT
jgi:hypothetical protein